MLYVVGIKGNESQVPLFAFYEPPRCADPNLETLRNYNKGFIARGVWWAVVSGRAGTRKESRGEPTVRVIVCVW
jgi:hypothetical protein